jgi:taurine dioxygenase
MKSAQITPFIGVELFDVDYEDLARPENFAKFVDLLHRHEMAVVRGLQLTPQQQISLARQLGEPVPFVIERYRHPDFPEIMISSNEVKNNKPVGVARVGNFWHQDSTFIADPAPYTMLHGVNVPSTSGHTLFASAIDIYRRLPQLWKSKIEDRIGIGSVAKRLRIRSDHVGLSPAEFKVVAETEHPPVEHPLVKIDPYTNRPYLYGSPEYLDSVIGFDANENEAFFGVINSLLRDDADYVYTHRWTPNDLVVWKTQTTYHAATDVEPGVGRTVHRVSIKKAAA